MTGTLDAVAVAAFLVLTLAVGRLCSWIIGENRKRSTSGARQTSSPATPSARAPSSLPRSARPARGRSTVTRRAPGEQQPQSRRSRQQRPTMAGQGDQLEGNAVRRFGATLLLNSLSVEVQSSAEPASFALLARLLSRGKAVFGSRPVGVASSAAPRARPRWSFCTGLPTRRIDFRPNRDSNSARRSNRSRRGNRCGSARTVVPRSDLQERGSIAPISREASASETRADEHSPGDCRRDPRLRQATR